MRQEDSFDYVSIIGANYMHPIADLLRELKLLDKKLPNQVQTSPWENGYSASTIVLTVVMLESFIRRTQYILNNNESNALKFIRSAFPDFNYIDKLEELFVVRDVIAHNHVWEAQIDWNESYGMNLLSLSRLPKGDKKYTRIIDLKNRKTKNLGINLFPTRINRFDVAFVLGTALHFLFYLDQIDLRYANISNRFVTIDGNPIKFVDFVEEFIAELGSYLEAQQAEEKP